MSAEAFYPHNEHLTPAERQKLIGERTLMIVQNELHTATTEAELGPKERTMLNSYFGAVEHYANLKVRTATAEQSPQVAHASHKFLRDVAIRKRESLQRKPYDVVFVIPEDNIARRIDKHYQDFGTNRRTKLSHSRAREESYIDENKRHLNDSMRLPWEDEDGNVWPTQGTRAKFYPEIAVGIHLEGVLRAMRLQVAADSVETVLSAYGQRFGELTPNPQARPESTSLIKTLDTHTIPESMQAEQPRQQ